MTKNKRLTLFVSSTIYDNEKLLDQLYPILTGFGYEVWMSHKGTLLVNPGETPFQSCLRAVEQCDLFLGIITPSYGSGVDKRGGTSIIHQPSRVGTFLCPRGQRRLFPRGHKNRAHPTRL